MHPLGQKKCGKGHTHQNNILTASSNRGGFLIPHICTLRNRRAFIIPQFKKRRNTHENTAPHPDAVFCRGRTGGTARPQRKYYAYVTKPELPAYDVIRMGDRAKTQKGASFTRKTMMIWSFMLLNAWHSRWMP